MSNKTSNKNTSENVERVKELTSISIISMPKKLAYRGGEKFNRNGMRVEAKYSDGSIKMVPLGELTVTPDVVSFGNDKTSITINVSYAENGVEKSDTLIVYKQLGVGFDDCNITQDFGACGTGSINLSTGDLTYGFEDFIGSDSVIPIAIMHIYVGGDKSVGAGVGWRLNIQQELKYEDSHWHYIDKTGKEYVFDNGYPEEDGRSSIRNEQLGLDLFRIDGRTIKLLDRSNNSLIFEYLRDVYRLTAMHQYPSTMDEPIDEYSMYISYYSNGTIYRVIAGHAIDDMYPTVIFGYNGMLLTSLQYVFGKTTTVAKYTYSEGKLISIEKCNANVNSKYSVVTEFDASDSAFVVTDKSSKDNNGNYKTLKYIMDSNNRVHDFSIGYGDDDREVTNVRYSGSIGQLQRSSSDPETSIVAMGYTRRNGTTSVVSFSSLSSVSTFAYENGESRFKPKRVFSASSCGFDYKALANVYSDTLDFAHDDFENGVRGWSGGTLSTDACICGKTSLFGNWLSKTYTTDMLGDSLKSMYLSLWAISRVSTPIIIDVTVEGHRGKEQIKRTISSSLVLNWQFIAIDLGRVFVGDTIFVKVSGLDVYIDDVRLTKAPYETPFNLSAPEYNAFGNISKQSQYNPGDKKVLRSEYEYNDAQQLVSITSTLDGEAHSKTEYVYNENGLLVSKKQYGTDSKFTQEEYIYSNYELSMFQDVNGIITAYWQRSDFLRSTVAGEQGSPDVTIDNTYFPDSGFLRRVESNDTKNELLYTTSGAPRLVRNKYTDGDTDIITTRIYFEYDTFGNVNNVKIGSGQVVSFEYDWKHLNKVQYANDYGISYTYDSKDRLTDIIESGGYNVHIQYYEDDTDTVLVQDSNGVRYRTRTINTGGKTSEYSAWFENSSVKLEMIGYAANGAGNQTSVGIYVGNSLFEKRTTTTNGNGQLESIKRESHANTSYKYDSLYRLSKKSTMQLASAYMFDTSYGYVGGSNNRQRMQVKSETLKLSTLLPIKTLDSYTYEYYDNGNLASIKSDSKQYATYVYDKYGRIIEENNYALSEAYRYSYDTNGNILEKITYPITNGVVSSSPKKTDVYGYTFIADSGHNGSWKDELKSYNGVAIKYDAIGNPTSYRGKTMTWNGRKLVKLDNTEMQYNYNNLRVKKGNKYYYWQDSNIILERWSESGTQKLAYYYYDETGVCGMNYGGNDYYFRKNILGDILAIYGISGNLLCRYVYDAWGNHKLFDSNGKEIADDGSTVGSINPFRYRGYYWDREFGLYYLKSRYYDPEVGRFISLDDVSYVQPESIFGLNLYAYCNDNPVMNSDPDGTFISVLIAVLASIALGAVINGISEGVAAASTGGDFWAGFTGGVVSGAIVTVGLAVAFATGGVGGLAIAAFGGGIASFAGSVVQQGMSKGWSNIKYGMAAASGGIGAFFGAVSYGLLGFVMKYSVGVFDGIFDKTVKHALRFVSALSMSAGSFMLTMMFAVPLTIMQTLINVLVYLIGMDETESDGDTYSIRRLA